MREVLWYLLEMLEWVLLEVCTVGPLIGESRFEMSKVRPYFRSKLVLVVLVSVSLLL